LPPQLSAAAAQRDELFYVTRETKDCQQSFTTFLFRTSAAEAPDLSPDAARLKPCPFKEECALKNPLWAKFFSRVKVETLT
jgi:hypothetical protein